MLYGFALFFLQGWKVGFIEELVASSAWFSLVNLYFVTAEDDKNKTNWLLYE